MLTHEKLVEIEKKISSDFEKEIDLIKKELYLLLDQNFDLYFLKEFVKHYPPKILRERSEVLLETLLNYFMKDLLDYVKTLDPEKQYLFFKENVREKIKSKYYKELNNLIPIFIKINEEQELEKKLPIIGSVVLSSGGIATAIILPESLLIKSIPAASSILASIYILKSYKDYSKRLKKKWKKIVAKFLDSNKKIIQNWLDQAKKDILFEINKLYQELGGLHSNMYIEQRRI